MYCERCGSQIKVGDKFCGNCGSLAIAASNGRTSVTNATPSLRNTPKVNRPSMLPSTERPVGQLKTNRGMLKTIFLSAITFGIYYIVSQSGISNDINIIASRYDGRKTMHYCLLLFIVGPITVGIGNIVWRHKISSRIGRELSRRNIPYSFSAGTWWLCHTLGLIIAIGPLIYLHKLCKAMNLLCEDYNKHG